MVGRRFGMGSCVTGDEICVEIGRSVVVHEDERGRRVWCLSTYRM